MDPKFATSLAVFAGLLALGAAIAVVRIRSIRRDLRDFAYLERDDPSAYRALVDAHAPRLRREFGWLLLLPVVVGLLGVTVVADWREYRAETGRLDAAVRSDPGHVVEQEHRVGIERYMVLDDGHVLRLYYRAAHCVLSRVESLMSAAEVQVSVYGGSPTGDQRVACGFSVTGGVPNRYVDARLSAPLGDRRVVGAGTEVRRHYWPWLAAATAPVASARGQAEEVRQT